MGFRSKRILSEEEILELYGKSVWEMTADELYEFDLIDSWVRLVDLYASASDNS